MLIRWCILVSLSAACAFAGGEPFPRELVEFVPYAHNPVFAGRGAGHWDEFIRERGWIVREDGEYRLWYTGYAGKDGERRLGYATSRDGLTWERYGDGPIDTEHWVEDMTVIKVEGTYQMFAESKSDEAFRMSSTDRIHWKHEGTLDIRKVNGEPIAPGPFGTPTVFHEDGTWYLFYERKDEAVWLAASKDLKVWKNVQDEPVFKRGPGDYDLAILAFDQIVKYEGRYYAYYHGLIPKTKPQEWTSGVAVSNNLIHWEKFAGNPIVAGDKSSPELVREGNGEESGGHFRLYTMHPTINVYLPRIKPVGKTE